MSIPSRTNLAFINNKSNPSQLELHYLESENYTFTNTTQFENHFENSTTDNFELIYPNYDEDCLNDNQNFQKFQLLFSNARKY